MSATGMRLTRRQGVPDCVGMPGRKWAPEVYIGLGESLWIIDIFLASGLASIMISTNGNLGTSVCLEHGRPPGKLGVSDRWLKC